MRTHANLSVKVVYVASLANVYLEHEIIVDLTLYMDVTLHYILRQTQVDTLIESRQSFFTCKMK